MLLISSNLPFWWRVPALTTTAGAFKFILPALFESDRSPQGTENQPDRLGTAGGIRSLKLILSSQCVHCSLICTAEPEQLDGTSEEPHAKAASDRSWYKLRHKETHI